MNNKTVLLTTVLVLIVLTGVLVVQSALPTHQESAVTPTQQPPIASPATTPLPVTPSAPPEPAVKIDSVSIDNATAASVTASSQTGGEIIITEIILKNELGITLATDDSIYQTLPADGSSEKITINQHNVQFTLGGTFTLTIVTSYGASYTSQSTCPLFY